MKIVITGALGHIGSYVLRDLAYKFPGTKFVLIDNLVTQRFTSLFNLPELADYNFIEGDVRDLDLRPILENAYAVIHLAAITDATASFSNAENFEANNYNATLKVLEACSQTDTRLLALSSTSVYGTQKKIVTEDCNAEDLKPQSPYATTKIKEEQLIEQFTSQGKLKAISCRFGTIYGKSPGMRFHTAVNKFCWQAVSGKPLTIWSTAFDQKRPYLDLVDASRVIGFILENDLFDGRIYNILTQNSTVCEIVETIQEFVPNLAMKFVDNEIMNQLSYEVSSARIMSQGFNFEGNLRRGIGETIKILRQSNSLRA